MIIKRAALNAVLPATSNDSRYMLKSVCLEPDGRAIATNGHVLLIASDNQPIEDVDFPIIAGAEFHGTPKGQTLVDADVMRSLLSAMPKKTSIPVLHCVQVSMNGSPSTVTVAATDLAAPRIATVDRSEQAQFPAYDKVMPASEQPTRLVLAVDVLETLIKAAKAVAGKRKPMIQFDIPANGKIGAVDTAVHVTMTGDDVTVTGAAMPCGL